MHLRFCRAWQLYVRWGETIIPQGSDEAGETDSRAPDWKPAQQVVNAFRGLAEQERFHLAELLRQSDDRLSPLADPFRLMSAGNRWLDLQREREESYSDWLAWSLEQMGQAEQVLRVFGLEDSEFGTLVHNEKVSVSREEPIRTPGGEAKRLDIVVRFGDAGILLVEVKIQDLDDAGGRENLPIYCAWLEKRQPDPKHRHAILLVPSSIESPCPGWDVLAWDDVSLKLRLRALAQIKPIPGNLLFAAMLLCFASAVEQNILGWSGTGDAMSTPQTALYLERFLEEKEL